MVATLSFLELGDPWLFFVYLTDLYHFLNSGVPQGFIPHCILRFPILSLMSLSFLGLPTALRWISDLHFTDLLYLSISTDVSVSPVPRTHHVNIFLVPVLTLPVDFPVSMDVIMILPDFQIENFGFRFDISFPLSVFFLCLCHLGVSSLFALPLSHSRSHINYPPPSQPLVA